MREIVLDTETTGLDPFQGHRLVEIGCVELVNGIPSGQTFHRYLNPERSMPEEAFAIHSTLDGFLKDKPLFAEIVDELIDFLGDAPLVIHNAGFDIGFLNAEFELAGRPLSTTRAAPARGQTGGPNDIEVMTAARTMSDNNRRLTMAGFRMVARERMIRFPLDPLSMEAITGHICTGFH